MDLFNSIAQQIAGFFWFLLLITLIIGPILIVLSWIIVLKGWDEKFPKGFGKLIASILLLVIGFLLALIPSSIYWLPNAFAIYGLHIYMTFSMIFVFTTLIGIIMVIVGFVVLLYWIFKGRKD